ncbi:MAG: hypothetical protein AAF719_13910 [Pseudomonadota bacterium]
MQARHISALLLGLLLVSLNAAADPSEWPDLLKEAVSNTDDDPNYAYDMVLEFSGEDAAAPIRVAIDPKAEPGAQVSILSAPDEDTGQDVKEDISSDVDGIGWCDTLGEMIADSVNLAKDTAQIAVFEFKPKPNEDAEERERKMFKHLQAELTIDKATRRAKGFRYYLPEPYKPAIIAKINEFEVTGACDDAPNGRPYISSVSTKIRGNAMGQAFSESIVQRFENLR